MLNTSLTLPNGNSIPNRLAKAAMSEGLGTPDGKISPALIRLYQRWAAGGAGLLITGNVMVDDRARELATNIVVEDDTDLASLQRWAQAGTERGGRIWMQINHPGRQVPKSLSAEPVAPAAVAVNIPGRRGMFAVPRALSDAEILDVIARFARSAEIAEKAGFDGVQVHAAHGYLISQFLSPLVNQRTDRWGGTLPNRARFVLEVVRAIRQRVSPEFDVAIKLNSADFQRGGFGPRDARAVVKMLNREGLDLLEISGGSYEQPTMMAGAPTRERSQKREAFFLEYAQEMRDIAEMPLMVTGGFRSHAAMETALATGAIDIVGMARPFAFDPDAPQRLLAGDIARVAEPAFKALRNPTINGLAQTALAQRQFRRMGQGREPMVRTSIRWNLLRSMLASEFAARRYRRHIADSCAAL